MGISRNYPTIRAAAFGSNALSCRGCRLAGNGCALSGRSSPGQQILEPLAVPAAKRKDPSRARDAITALPIAVFEAVSRRAPPSSARATDAMDNRTWRECAAPSKVRDAGFTAMATRTRRYSAPCERPPADSGTSPNLIRRAGSDDMVAGFGGQGVRGFVFQLTRRTPAFAHPEQPCHGVKCKTRNRRRAAS